jgi:predicted ATPase
VQCGIVSGSGGRFTFAHDLFRETLYDDLPPDERRSLHGAVGAGLERLYAADIELHLAELAHHFFHAAPGNEQAIRYPIRAAERAAHQLAFQEAAGHCQAGLEALAASDTPNAVRRCEILLSLGENLWKMGAIDRAREIHAEAADLADALALPEAQARAALGFGGHDVTFDRANLEPQLVQLLERALVAIGPADSLLRAALMARLGTALAFSRPDRPCAEALGRAAVEMARRLGDTHTLHFVLCCFICAVWGPDNLDERLATSTEIAGLSGEIGAAGIAEIDVSLVAHLDEAGDAAGAQREVDKYLQRTQVARRHIATWILTVWSAMTALVRGRFDEAETLASEALQLGDQEHNPNASQYFGAQIIALRREQGRLAEIVDGIEAFAAGNPELPIWRAALAWVHAELERTADAQRELERLGDPGAAIFPGIGCAGAGR